jgi:hypothetical protein
VQRAAARSWAAAWTVEGKDGCCEESEISGVSFEWIMVEIADLTIWSNGAASDGRRGGEIEEIVSV